MTPTGIDVETEKEPAFCKLLKPTAEGKLAGVSVLAEPEENDDHSGLAARIAFILLTSSSCDGIHD